MIVTKKNTVKTLFNSKEKCAYAKYQRAEIMIYQNVPLATNILLLLQYKFILLFLFI